MAEILLKATSPKNPTPEQEPFVYKVGMPVVVMPDGHPWGNAERLPLFCRINLPGVPVDKVMKYIEASREGKRLRRRRVWQFTLDALPATAREKLFTVGELTIKVSPSYKGFYDFTWREIRNYLKNLDTGLTETVEL